MANQLAALASTVAIAGVKTRNSVNGHHRPRRHLQDHQYHHQERKDQGQEEAILWFLDFHLIKMQGNLIFKITLVHGVYVFHQKFGYDVSQIGWI